MRGRGVALLIVTALLLVSPTLGADHQGSPGSKRWVPPKDAWTCPASHPIKGNLTTRTGECIYHVPSGAFYLKTKPERCFTSEEDARLAGCRRSRVQT